MPSNGAGATEGFAARAPPLRVLAGARGGRAGVSGPRSRAAPAARVGSSRRAQCSRPLCSCSRDAGARLAAAPPGALSSARAPPGAGGGRRLRWKASRAPPGLRDLAPALAAPLTWHLAVSALQGRLRFGVAGWRWAAGGVGSQKVCGGRRRDPARGSLPAAAPLPLPIAALPHPVAAALPSANSERASGACAMRSLPSDGP